MVNFFVVSFGAGERTMAADERQAERFGTSKSNWVALGRVV